MWATHVEKWSKEIEQKGILIIQVRDGSPALPGLR